MLICSFVQILHILTPKDKLNTHSLERSRDNTVAKTISNQKTIKAKEENGFHLLAGTPSETENAPIVWMRFEVEMAGIEPASERLDPRKSTSVSG